MNRRVKQITPVESDEWDRQQTETQLRHGARLPESGEASTLGLAVKRGARTCDWRPREPVVYAWPRRALQRAVS